MSAKKRCRDVRDAYIARRHAGLSTCDYRYGDEGEKYIDPTIYNRIAADGEKRYIIELETVVDELEATIARLTKELDDMRGKT